MKNIFLVFVLYCAVMMMFVSQTLYNNHQEDNITFDIYNFTETALVWNYTSQQDTIKDNFSDMTGYDYDKIQSQRVSNIVNKFVDWVGYTLFEFSKWSIEFGYTHPEYDFEFFMNFLKYVLIITLIAALVPLIIPFIALLYIGVMGIKQGYNYIKNRKKDE